MILILPWLFLIILMVDSVMGLTVNVDPDQLSDPDNYVVADLQAAFNLIYKTGALPGSDNTIILAASTANTIQPLQNIFINDTAGGITILFENVPNTGFSQENDCDDLPIISISKQNQSSVSLIGLTYFTLEGVHLLISDSNLTLFSGIQNFSITHSCIMNNYTAYLSDILTYNLQLDNISSMTFTNSFLHQRTRAGFHLQQGGQVTIQNITICLGDPGELPAEAYYDHTFYILGNSRTNSTLSAFINNINVFCEASLSEPIATQAVFNVRMARDVVISDVQMHDCFFHKMKNQTFSVYYSYNVTLSNINITNMTLFLNRFSPDYSQNFGIVSCFSCQHFSLSDFYYGNSYMNGSEDDQGEGLDMITVDWYFPFTDRASTIISNVTVENTPMLGKGTIVRLQNSNPKTYGDLLVNNITISNCSLGFGTIISILPNCRDNPGSRTETEIFPVQKLNVSNSYLYNTEVVRLANEYFNAYLNELYKVVLYDGILNHNVFNGTNQLEPFDVIGGELTIINLNASNNTLSKCIFASDITKKSSFILINSSFSDLFIEEGASFLAYALSQTNFLYLDALYKNDTEKIFEIEFRPFMIVNCSFTNVALEAGAVFISSTNPMILLINNTFHNITSSSSSLVTLGGYIPLTSKPEGFSYGSTKQFIQDNILWSPGAIQWAFTESRNELFALKNNSQVPMYFVYVKNNVFFNVTTNEELRIIGVSNVALETSAVGFVSNTLEAIVVDSQNDFNVFGITEVNELFIVGNAFYNISGSNSIVKAKSTTIQNMLIDSNSISVISEGSGYALAGSTCATILLIRDIGSHVETQDTWISIECQELRNSISITDADYYNISIISNENRLNGAFFLKVHTQQVPDGAVGNFYIQRCSLTQIVIDKSKQLYTKDMFNSPVIQLALSNTAAIIEENKFVNLKNDPVDSILCVSALNISFIDSIFQNMVFHEDSGGLYLVSSKVTFSNTTFLENHAQPGQGGGLIIFINPNQKTETIVVEVESCTFANNAASLIACEDSALSLKTNNSIISNNCGLSTGLIDIINAETSSLTFTRTKFQHDHTMSNSDCIYYDFIIIQYAANTVNLAFDDCLLNISDNFVGQLIVLNGNSQVLLDASKLHYFSAENSNQTSPSSFGILKADRFVGTFSDLIVNSMDLSNTKLFSINCVKQNNASFFGQLVLRDSSFQDLRLESAHLIYIASEDVSQNDKCELQVQIHSTNFTNVTTKPNNKANGLIIASELVSSLPRSNPDETFINISQCAFTNITSLTGGIYFGLPQYNGDSISIERSTFHSVKAYESGGIVHIQNPNTTTTTLSTSESSNRILVEEPNQQFSFTNNAFFNISAKHGGVLYANFSSPSTTMTLHHNKFENVTVDGRGGVLYFNDSKLIATDNQFGFVSATISGPLIYSDHMQFDSSAFFAQNEFQNYSDDSSTPPSLAFAPNSLKIQFLPDFGNLQNFSNVITDITSYSLNEYFLQITLQYTDNQTSQIVAAESSEATIQLNFTFGRNLGNKIKSEYCYSSICNVSLAGIQLLGESQDTVQITATYQSYGELQYYAQSRLLIQLRECLPGEITDTVSKTCTPCLSGFYSLNTSDKTCKQCPPEAKCFGGVNISLNESYWRNSILSDLIVHCNDSGVRCKGGYHSNCSEIYTGPVCLQCNTELQYYPQSDGSCGQCVNNARSVAYGVFIFAVGLAYQAFVIITAYRGSNKSFLEYEKKDSSDDDSHAQQPPKPDAYLSIFTTYTQMSSVFFFGAGNFLTDGFNVASTLGNSSKKVFFSLQCFLLLVTPDTLGIMKAKVFLFIFSPAAKLISILIIELLRNFFANFICKKQGEKKQRIKQSLMRLGVTAIGLINLEQPGIIGVLCDYLSCVQLDPNESIYYISTNNNIQCGTDQYNYFRYVVVIPALLCYGFLLPLAIVLLLYKKRDQLLNSKTLYVMFGAFYSNYGVKAYYWGLSTVIFKIMIFFLDSILRSTELGKGTTLALIVHLYYLLYTKVAPRLNKELGKVEGYIIRSYMWTIVLTLLRGSIENIIFQRILEAVIFAVNVGAVSILLFRLLGSYKRTFMPLIQKILDKFRRLSKRNAIDIDSQSPSKDNSSSIDLKADLTPDKK